MSLTATADVTARVERLAMHQPFDKTVTATGTAASPRCSTPPTSARGSTASGGDAGEDASSTTGSVLSSAKQPQAGARKRVSKVAFLEHVGLQGTDNPKDNYFDWDLFDVDEEETHGADDNAGSAGAGAVVTTFAMADDSDEEMDCDSDAYDEYDFDETKLVEMVKSGADSMKLSETIQEAMAAAFERKLHAKAKPASEFQPCSDNPDMYDVAGAMTPGRGTPPDVEATGAAVLPEDVAARMQEAADGQARRRRSSAAPRRSSAARKGGTDAVSLAAGEAVARHRRSVAARAATVEAEGEDAAKLQQAVSEACGRRRLSISKAADVLESAGFCDSGLSQAEAAKQLSVVAEAVEDARKKHRQSIAKAVQQLEANATIAPPSSSLSAKATTFKPVEQVATFKPAMNNSEDRWATSMQAKMNCAVASAYQEYSEYDCYNQQYCNDYSEQYDGSGQGCSDQYGGYQQPTAPQWQSGGAYGSSACAYDSSASGATGCYSQDGWSSGDTYHQGYGQALASYDQASSSRTGQASSGQTYYGHGNQEQAIYCGHANQEQGYSHDTGDGSWGANSSWASGAW